MTIFKHALLSLSIIILWIAFIGLGFTEGYLLRPISSDRTPNGFIEATQERLKKESVGNFAMHIIENGQVVESLFYGPNQNINENSIFPVASISKWLTSMAIHQLVEEGVVELDKPVDDYLTRWHLPQSEYDAQEVTLGRLLSHSGGLVDDLGYSGFPPGTPIQSLEASLTKAADTDYSDGAAIIGYEPGSRYMYSGASYTLLQLLIEEVTGQSFSTYMQYEVFAPLGMTHSTFDLSSRADLEMVSVFRTDGSKRPMNNFTALAAAGLMTSVEDLSKFMSSLCSSDGLLNQHSINNMAEPVTFLNNIPYYSLGPKYFSQTDERSHIIGHDGSGNDAINTAARINLKTKNGIVILETGHYDLASTLADEWMFSEAGIADFVVMTRNFPYLRNMGIIGLVIIILLSVIRFQKQKKVKIATTV